MTLLPAKICPLSVVLDARVIALRDYTAMIEQLGGKAVPIESRLAKAVERLSFRARMRYHATSTPPATHKIVLFRFMS